MEYLEFERPLKELTEKIDALCHVPDDENLDIGEEVKRLEKKRDALMQSIYEKLSDWQVIQLARHPDRPYSNDYFARIFTEFDELKGDRLFADDPAIVGGLAKLNDQPVMIIGQQKGRSTKQKIHRNFGMPHPEGYRKALRLMKLAERFKLPVVTFIDTPGAYPGINAEARGQSEAIAHNLREMSALKVPIICVVIGEGCSGGAVGIGVGDRMIMLEYSYFATISPEGCASILWKSADKAPDAAEIMGITANRLKELGIIDDIIEEPMGGAHREVDVMAARIKARLTEHLDTLQKLPVEQMLDERYQKLMAFGRFEEKIKE